MGHKVKNLFKSAIIKNTIRREEMTKKSLNISHQKRLINSHSEIKPNESRTSTEKPYINSSGIEMLPSWLYSKIFRLTTRPEPHKNRELVSSKHLEEQKLAGRISDAFPLIKEFDSLLIDGSSIAEHFWKIGSSQANPYIELAKGFVVDDLPETPSNWILQEGWTRYKKDIKPEKVEFPKEKILCFDVETMHNDSNYSLIACAVSPEAWYAWVSPKLIEHKQEVEKSKNNNAADSKDNENLTTNNKNNNKKKKIEDIFRSSNKVGSLIPMGNMPDTRRIIIGHNVGYDRARILEEYSYKHSGIKFIDTMSLHIAVNGLSSNQRSTWIKYKKAIIEDDNDYLDSAREFKPIYDVSSINSLQDVYRLHYGEGLDKSSKDFFIKGTLDDIIDPENFQKIITYCANDVIATHKIYCKVLPQFLDVCPHPVSFAGMLQMGNMFLTTSNDWNDYINKAETMFQKKCKDLHDSLTSLAEDTLKEGTSNPEKIKDDFFLKQLDWACPTSNKVRKLPTHPNWYRDIYNTKTNELKITSRMRIAPLLLKLKWNDFPLYYSKKYGWTYRVPIENTTYVTKAKPCVFREEKKESSSVVQQENQIDLRNMEHLTEEHNEAEKSNKTENNKTKKVVEEDEKLADDKDGVYYRIPHKDGDEHRCETPFAKHYINDFEKEVLSSEYSMGKNAIQMSVNCSYWISCRERIISQMVTVAMGTVTRRAVEKTWMTASNVKENRIGSELKALIQAPEGYKIVGADVDSEELWISSLIGDSQFGFHGSTAMGWMTLQGTKAEGTDMHSRTAQILKISRSDAKVFNYGRIYGAGLKFASQLLRQFNEDIIEEEATERATELYEHTKGKRFYSKDYKELKRRFLNYDYFWYGGSESYMFNSLENIAISESPRTPVLKCGITEALNMKVVKKGYMTSRINWVVQSSGVDYLHLLLVSMEYLITKYKINARFMISVHDEIRFLVEEKDSYRAALALQISNLWTRSMFSYMLGIMDLPSSVAFFSGVDIDHVLRKEVEMKCKTISYDAEVKDGESLTIQELLEKITTLGEETTSSDDINDDGYIKQINNINNSELLKPCDTFIDDTFLEIQSLSNDKDVLAKMRNTEHLNAYSNYSRAKERLDNFSSKRQARY
nr:9930_t:CDS:2 [Entrophospora candida]